MMRSTVNSIPETGAVTSPFCLKHDGREQGLIGWARTSLVRSAPNASVSVPCSLNSWKHAA